MKKSVLLAVDDKPDNLYTLQSLFAEHLPDCELLTAAGGAEGLVVAAENDLDGVLVDVQMPEMDGFEMCQRLKSDERTAHIPVILITAHHTDPKLKAEGLQAGADDFLTRPINNVELVARIKVMLRIKHSESLLRNMNAHLDKLVDERTQALRASEERLELFFSQSLDGFFFMMLEQPVRWDDSVDQEEVLEVIFANQRMTKVNDAMLGQYGAAREDFLGVTPNELFAHNLPHGKNLWRRMLDAGRAHLESNEQRMDGSPMIIEGDYLCIYDETGRFTGHFGIQRDITKRKRIEGELEKHRGHLEELVAERTAKLEEAGRKLEESEERFRTVFEQSADAVVLLDAETGALVEFNDNAHNALGYTRDEFKKMTVANFEVIESAEDVAKRIENIRRDDTDAFETKHRTKAGEVRDILVSARLISIRGKSFIQSIWHDITDRKRAEEERDRKAAELRKMVKMMAGRENRMAELKKSIQRLRTQLEKAGLTPVADDPLKEGRRGKGEG